MTVSTETPTPPPSPAPNDSLEWGDLGGLLASVSDNLAALIGVLGVLWFLLKPRVERFVAGVNEAAGAAKQAEQQTHEVYRQLTVNGGRSEVPTLLDRLHQLAENQVEIRRQLVDVRQDVRTLGRSIDNVADDVTASRDDGAAYMARALPILKAHGIDLPDYPREERPDNG